MISDAARTPVLIGIGVATQREDDQALIARMQNEEWVGRHLRVAGTALA